MKTYMEGLDTGGGLRFRTGAGGEDWGGLAERLELSSIYLKGEAMQVVCGDIEDFDRREEASGHWTEAVPTVKSFTKSILTCAVWNAE